MNEEWLSNGVVYRSESRRKLAAANLKRCPLCGGLNAKNNRDCFVCGWHGRFDLDPVRIEESLLNLLDRCPELKPELPRPRVTKFRAFLNRVFRKRIDYKI